MKDQYPNWRGLGCNSFLSLLPSGCNGKKLPTIVKAEGIITLDGAPVENATITFISEKTFRPSLRA